MILRPLAFLLAILAAALPARAAAPARVVSLNLCTDQLLVLLAPEKIVALSTLSRDPSISFVAKAARRLPVAPADAEAVLRLRPDLVLAGAYGAQTTVAVLRELGVPVLVADMPRDFAAIRAQTRRIGAALGVPDRAEALIAAMDRRLAAAKPRPDAPCALMWEARGWTAGPGSLGDAVLRAAGFRDAGTGGQVGLEALVAHPPDLLVVEDAHGFPSLATALLNHPAMRGIPRETLDPALLICGGPQTARAVTALR